jgi:hypothetical protein
MRLNRQHDCHEMPPSLHYPARRSSFVDVVTACVRDKSGLRPDCPTKGMESERACTQPSPCGAKRLDPTAFEKPFRPNYPEALATFPARLARPGASTPLCGRRAPRNLAVFRGATVEFRKWRFWGAPVRWMFAGSLHRVGDSRPGKPRSPTRAGEP